MRTPSFSLAATIGALTIAHAASAAAPVSLEPPTISGSGLLGHPLVASTGRWTVAGRVRFSFTWLRCDMDGSCSRILHATKHSYRPTRSEVGKAVRVRVRAAVGAHARTSVSPLYAGVREPPEDDTLFADGFDGPDGLLTNEYAEANATDAASRNAFGWLVTSGSLFRRGGAAWTGRPDNGTVSPDSSGANDSAVFRLVTRRRDFGDVSVRFSLVNDGLVTTDRTPARDYDGAHVFLRYQRETSLYVASANRRDDTVVIKKKCPGGPSNGGTYYTLGEFADHEVAYGEWQHIEATVQNSADGTVTIDLAIDGATVVHAIDDGVGCATIRQPGRVGIRGDNAELEIDDFRVLPG